MTIVFDLDGTLVNIEGLHQYAKNVDSYDRFHELAADAPPNQWVLDEFNSHKNYWYNTAVVIITARSEKYRDSTKAWLLFHRIHPTDIMMRAVDDFRNDPIVKSDLIDEVERLYGPVTQAYEDNPSVVQMLLARKIPTTIYPGYPDDD